MLRLRKSTVLLSFLFILATTSTVWFAFAATENVVAVGKPEKIFRHDRLDPQKFARVDLDNEELQRALEDLRRRVPEYTGYLFLDILFEICKMLFIFLLGPHQRQQQDFASA